MRQNWSMSTNIWVGVWLSFFQSTLGSVETPKSTIIQIDLCRPSEGVRSSYANWSQPRTSTNVFDVDYAYRCIPIPISTNINARNWEPTRNIEFSYPRKVFIPVPDSQSNLFLWETFRVNALNERNAKKTLVITNIELQHFENLENTVWLRIFRDELYLVTSSIFNVVINIGCRRPRLAPVRVRASNSFGRPT